MNRQLNDSHVIKFLWVRFASGEKELREIIFNYYIPWLNLIISKFMNHYRYPLSEYGDYFNFGTIGLLLAIDRYDYSREIKFETYAEPYVKGTILKGLAPYIQDKKNVVNDRIDLLLNSERDASDSLISLAEIIVGLAFGEFLQLGIIEEKSPSYDEPYQAISGYQDYQRLKQLVDKLPDNQRIIIQLHYFDGVGFTEIAETLKLTKGRISQLHQKALEFLRINQCL